MKRINLQNKRGFFSLILLLFVVGIIGYLVIGSLGGVSNVAQRTQESPSTDQEILEGMTNPGTSAARSVLDHYTGQIHDIERQQQQRADQMMRSQ